MRNTLRSLLYGTTILAGLAAFVDGAPAQDNRPHAVGLRAGMPVSGTEAPVKSLSIPVRVATPTPVQGDSHAQPGSKNEINALEAGRAS